jgi:hypothetical protein
MIVKGRYSLFLLLLGLAAGVVISRHTAAQPAATSGIGSEVVMQRLQRLLSDLSARGQTNTIAQVTSLLAARDTLTNTKDASMAVALLQRLRAGQTNEAIEVLELTLDNALISLAASPQEIGEAQLKTLEMAKQYRAKYPRNSDPGVSKAFDLLDKK